MPRGTTWHVREDPGLQPERTELAWQRTMLSFLGASMLLLRWVDSLGGPVVTMFAVASVSAAFIMIHTGRRLRHIAPTFPDVPATPAIAEVAMLTGLQLLLGILGLWTVLAHL